MALTVYPAEPADSYCTVAFATQYFADRGNAAWAALASDTVREQFLRKSADYMTEQYRTRWAGSRVSVTQNLDWPRYDVPMKDSPGWYYYPSDAVPVEIQRACAEFALRASAGELTVDVGRLKSKTRVGPIEVEYVAGSSAQTRYTAVDNLLAPFLKGGGGQIPVVRC